MGRYRTDEGGAQQEKTRDHAQNSASRQRGHEGLAGASEPYPDTAGAVRHFDRVELVLRLRLVARQ